MERLGEPVAQAPDLGASALARLPGRGAPAGRYRLLLGLQPLEAQQRRGGDLLRLRLLRESHGEAQRHVLKCPLRGDEFARTAALSVA